MFIPMLPHKTDVMENISMLDSRVLATADNMTVLGIVIT